MEKFAKQVNEEYLSKQNAENPLDAIICNVLSTEIDEMWSFYHDKSDHPWGVVWLAADHATNTPLAFTFGTLEHKNLDKLLGVTRAVPNWKFIRIIILIMKNVFLHNSLFAEKITLKK